MSTENFRLYNQFALQYRRVLKNKVSVADLMQNMDELQKVLSESMKSGDQELIQVATLVAKELGVSVLTQKSSTAPSSSTSGSNANSTSGKTTTSVGSLINWAKIEKAAMKVGGPIGVLVVKQVRAEGPATEGDAVSLVAVKLGSAGREFLKEM